MLIFTTKGLVERETLKVRDVVTWEENARVIATEWYDQYGELVRRDVWVSILRGQSMTAEQGSTGG